MWQWLPWSGSLVVWLWLTFINRCCSRWASLKVLLRTSGPWQLPLSTWVYQSPEFWHDREVLGSVQRCGTVAFSTELDFDAEVHKHLRNPAVPLTAGLHPSFRRVQTWKTEPEVTMLPSPTTFTLWVEGIWECLCSSQKPERQSRLLPLLHI